MNMPGNANWVCFKCRRSVRRPAHFRGNVTCPDCAQLCNRLGTKTPVPRKNNDRAWSELREQLLALSDLEQTYSYCLLDTPIPMFNYVAHVRLLPVTDGDRTFWHWESRFTTRPADAAEITEMVSEQIYQAGFEAIRRHLQGAA